MHLYGWLHGGGDRAVLYFHGNAAVLGGDWPMPAVLADAGWTVLELAARGYEGRPSEAGMRLDALAALAFLADNGIPAERVVLHGRSMGGGVAGTVMNDAPVAGLVLHSTFTSVVDVARRTYGFYPLRLLVRHPFDTASRAPAFAAPVLVLHSRDDEIIGVEHGRRLAELFPNARLVEEGGFGHNDDMLTAGNEAWPAYLAFVERAMPSR